MTIFFSILILTLAYLIGSIPTGLIIGKVFFQKNLHEEGSGATGTTNSMRVLGKKAAAFVFLFDIIKALIPALITLFFKLPVNISIIAFATVLGHCFPIFAQFKGGKAVATSFGFFAFFFPWPTTLGLLAFTISFILYDMISLSSILSASTVLLIVLANPSESLFTKLFVFFIWALLIFRHKDNIERIIKKAENKIVISLKKKMIFVALTSIIVIISSLFTLATPKDNATLKNLFDSEITHLNQQKQYYESIAKSSPSPKSYYNLYKSQILHDAYTLITYDIQNSYTPALQNDTSDRLIVDYKFSTRINLNANEADEIFEKYSLQYQTLAQSTKQIELLEEMNNYLLQKYPASRTQREPEQHISLQYLKVNNNWILPANEQINLTNYLNEHIFVNNFSTSYLGSDENALSLFILQHFPNNSVPNINSNISLTDFSTAYITHLKNRVFTELSYTIENSNKSTTDSIETMFVTYQFNSKTIIPTKAINDYVRKKQSEIDALPPDQKEQAIKIAKQEIIDSFPKTNDKTLPLVGQLILPFSKTNETENWTLSENDIARFKNYVETHIISETT